MFLCVIHALETHSIDSEHAKTASGRARCASAYLPTWSLCAKPRVCAGVSINGVGPLGPAGAFEISSSDGYAQTGPAGRYSLGKACPRKKFLVVVQCGLAAVCGVVELLELISVIVALSGDVDEFLQRCASIQGLMA